MAGIEFDPTGLYHANARYYHPTLQRFISEDPARQGGSGANLFTYAGNNPVGGAALRSPDLQAVRPHPHHDGKSASTEPQGKLHHSGGFGNLIPELQFSRSILLN